MKWLATLFLVLAGTVRTLSQTPSPELTSADLWKPEYVPFSFTYSGQESAGFLTNWQNSVEKLAGGSGQIHRYFYRDRRTKLTVTAEVRVYPDFPGAVDWVLRFRNDGPSDTPIIENIMPLDWAIESSPGECFVRHARGSGAHADDFQPLEEHFGAGGKDHLESPGGDPSSRNTLPFFNLQTGDHGLIGAIGWTGGWKTDFTYAGDGKSIRLAGGMKRTHFLLHAGEEVRTPRIVLMRWTGGDWQDSQNSWRRLLLAHYTPRDNGKPMVGPVFFGSWGSEPINSKIAFIRWVHDHHIPVQLYAVDAGWYGDRSERKPIRRIRGGRIAATGFRVTGITRTALNLWATR